MKASPDHSKVRTRKEYITPEKAKQILARNHTSQRNTLNSRVTIYAEQMKAGQWLLNGHALIYDEDGKLVNGQHRLKACIAAGVGFWTIVVEGVARDAIWTVDTGKARSPGDVLQMNGFPNAKNLATAIRTIYMYKQQVVNGDPRLTGPSTGANHLTNSRSLQIAQAHGGLVDSVRFAEDVRCKGISVGMVAAVHYLGGAIAGQPNKANEWMQGVCVGDNLAVDSPMLRLRTEIMTEKLEGFYPQLYRAVDSFNRYVSGEPAPRRRGPLPGPVVMVGAEPAELSAPI